MTNERSKWFGLILLLGVGASAGCYTELGPEGEDPGAEVAAEQGALATTDQAAAVSPPETAPVAKELTPAKPKATAEAVQGSAQKRLADHLNEIKRNWAP
jgi:hypothetical protein